MINGFGKMVFLMTLLFLGLSLPLEAKDLTAEEIVSKGYYQSRSEKNYLTMKMVIIRPTWQREMEMRSWSLGNDYSLVRVDRPVKNKGMGTLKIKKEAWSYVPSISRAVKISSSQMSQSWMGSDFTNEDLLREASIIHDYTHRLLGTGVYEGVQVYLIESIPKENAPVVWGKVLSWYDKEKVINLKSEFYDEEDILVNTMLLSKVKKIANRYLPTYQEMIPQDKPGHKTVVEIKEIDFNPKLGVGFFSIQNLKRIR